MDIQNYFNYLILEIHIINTDSRGNVRYWSSSSIDEKFRWVYYDGDLSFGNPRLNYLGKRLSDAQTDWYNPYWTTLLLRKLMQNETLRHRFITQYCFLRSTMLSSDTFVNRIKFFRDWLEPEIDRHLLRKDFKQTRAAWEKRIQNLIRFARIRDTTSLQHLKENFSLGDMYTLSLNGNAPADFFHLWINGNRLPSTPYTGRYFRKVGATLEIRGIHPLYRFVSWSDGVKNPVRPVPADSSSFIELKAILRKVPFAKTKEHIQFKALATGRKDRLSFIYLTDSSRRHGPTKILINNLQGDLPIHCTIEPNKNQIVICSDIARFRRIYPGYSGQLLFSKDLSLGSDIKSLYVFADDGNLLDSVSFRGIKGILNINIPYYIRDSLYLTGTLERPLLPPLQFTDEEKEFRDSMVTLCVGLLLSLILIFGLPFLLVQRKRKVTMLIILMLPVIDQANAQDPFVSTKRHIDEQQLLQKGKIHRQLPESKNCYRFFCNYVPVKANLIWVAPFANEDIFSDEAMMKHVNQFYKELKSDDMMQVRMQFRGDTIRNFIRGSQSSTFALDAEGKWSLIKITHSNGMESWYYPIATVKQPIIPSQKGSVLGTGNGTYFWQIRYRDRSFALSGLLATDLKPDPKGYFLESGKQNNGRLQDRYLSFRHSIYLNKNEK